MWSCAITDIAHAQRFCLTVARLTIAEWRSVFIQSKKPFRKNNDRRPKDSHRTVTLCCRSFIRSCMYFKLLCYLQNEKIWVVVLQNQYMFAKNYQLHWIASTSNILRKYLMYIFFQFWSVAFAVPFLYDFQKLQLLGIKKIYNNFCCIVLLFV